MANSESRSHRMLQGSLSPDHLLYYGWLLFAFLVPVIRKGITIPILVLLLLSVFYFFTNRDRRIRRPGLLSWGFIILYLLYALGLIYSADLDSGLFDMQVKLSFIVFPLLLLPGAQCLQKEQRFRMIKLAFVAGSLLGTLICLVHAFYLSFTTFFTFDYFQYVKLSVIFHPSYFSMYLNVAILVLFLYLIESWDKLKTRTKILIPLLILYFLVFIIFLNSKAGMMISLLTLLILLGYLMVVRRRIWLGLVSMILLLAFSTFLMVRIPYLKNRMQSFWTVVTSSHRETALPGDGTTNRILIWEHSARIAVENLPFGVGTGDVRAALNASYAADHFNDGMEKNLNAHQQYLQTFMAIGLPGLTVLCLIFLVMLVQGFRRKDVYLLLLAMILAGNFLVESMLETQAGVIFSVFIITLYDMTERGRSREKGPQGRTSGH